MRANEVSIRIIQELDSFCDNIDYEKAKLVIDEILHNYTIKDKENMPVPLNNMQEMIMMYLAVRKTEGLADSTIESYGRNLARFAFELQKNVEDVTTMDIRIYLANYAKTGVKNSTVASMTNSLRAFFNWLFDEDYIPKNPMNRIKTIKIDSRLRKPLSHEELEMLRIGCKTLRQRAILEFLYATCMRLQELVDTNISDINWNDKKLNVIGKGNKERTVYFTDRAKIHLKRYLATRRDDCDALFVTERSPIRRLGNRGIQREINKISEQSGLNKNVYPHILRHTGATHMLESGIRIEVISKILGHSDLSTTEVYAKSLPAKVEYEYRKHMTS